MVVYSRPVWGVPTVQYRAHPGSVYRCSENVRKISKDEEYRSPTINIMRLATEIEFAKGFYLSSACNVSQLQCDYSVQCNVNV